MALSFQNLITPVGTPTSNPAGSPASTGSDNSGLSFASMITPVSQPDQTPNPNTTKPSTFLGLEQGNNSIPAKIVSAVTSSEQNVGKVIGQSLALNSKDYANAQTSNQNLQDQIFKTEQQIEQDKAQGKDTSHLEGILARVKQTSGLNLSSPENIAPDATTMTNAQAIGNVAGVGLDMLTAGIGGKAKVAEEAMNPVTASIVKNISGGVAKTSLADTLSNVGLKVAKGFALGYGYDVTNNLKANDVDFTPGLGALVGGASPVVTEGLRTLSAYLPRAIVKAVLPKLKEGRTLQYALDNTKGFTTDSMIQNSDNSIGSLKTQIDSVLNHPEYATQKVTSGETIINQLKTQLPNSEYTADNVFSKLKTLVPSQAALITKLQTAGGLIAKEANTLRSALDSVSYKKTIDAPEVKASKELAGTVGNILRDTVQSVAPETKPLFARFTKEINVNKALQAAKNKLEGKISVKDIFAATTGFYHSGVQGAIEAVIAERALTNPAVNINTAKVINGIGNVATKVADTVSPYAGVITGKLEGNGNNSPNQ